MTKSFVVIGAGVVGVCVSIQIKRRWPNSKVTVIEKENSLGFHASGRNSGVLHAGFYYTPDTIKAQLTRIGNIKMTEYCQKNNLSINSCGKIVVPVNDKELDTLDILLERAERNAIPVEKISADQAKTIEPKSKAHKYALWSPTTSSVDPMQVLNSLLRDAVALGIDIKFGCKYLGYASENCILTSMGKIYFDFFVNCAGLFADKIAKQFNMCEHYKLVPFKGLYLYNNNPKTNFNVHVYPVPNIDYPFLGVHTTQRVDNHTKIGPTAMPAFWPENYNWFKRFDCPDFIRTIYSHLKLAVFDNIGYKKLALEELSKMKKSKIIELCNKLVEIDLDPRNYTWGPPGIRAQLVNTKHNSLVQDFVIEQNSSSLHVLNLVSPGFTCSIPFAELVCDKISNNI